MAHFETLRRRIVVANREKYKAKREANSAKIVHHIMKAVDAACENPQFNERGLVEIDLTDAQKEAEKCGLGDMPIFSELGE